MRIGFDVSNTGRGKTGCGYYADGLLRGLAAVDGENEYHLYSAFGTVFFDHEHGTTAVTAPAPNFSRRLADLDHDACREFWSCPPPDAEALLGRPDLIHSNSYFCPRGLWGTRVVYTLYDLACFDLPESMPHAHRAKHAHELFEASVRADMVLAISDYTRRRFQDTFPHYPADRLRTVHPASRFALPHYAAPAAAPVAGLRPGGFWLTVATAEPRKNLRRLVEAWAARRAAGSALPLVVAGGPGWLEDGWEEGAAARGLEGDLRRLGYVDDASLLWLYRNCFGFVYAPLLEGFGLPVVEALGQGAATVASGGTGVEEVAGEAALLVEPTDGAALAAAMAALEGDDALRGRLRGGARARAARFSWEDAARRTLAAYAEAVARPPFASRP
jgi:glycosyltransferase involved in cell wall biosynthesis